MTEQPETARRLAAIMAADVAGYARLMEADEAATLAALEGCRALFRDAVAGRGGRLVDMAGDSVLAVFPSVVEAVACAREVQAALAARAADAPDDRRMRHRIGVNLGDVIEKADGSVYGDGVNVAARLQALAEPGGVVVSGTAFDQVEGRTDAEFADMGPQQVKNIARPVRAFRVVDPAAAAQAPPAEAQFWPWVWRAAILGQLGRAAEAREAVAELQRKRPDFTPLYFDRFLGFRNPAHRDWLTEGLVKAGLPPDGWTTA